MYGRPAFGLNIGRIAVICLMAVVGQFSTTTRAADLPKEILSADNARQYADTIHKYVAGRAADLQSPDPAKVKSAREGLIENVRGIVPPTGSFQDVYCGELASTLKPLATNSDPRVRLNVAIVAERVAERTLETSFRLEELLLVELKDANSGIVLWAMQASRYVLVPVLNVSGSTSKLVPAILDAAKKTSSGAVVSAAYLALSCDTGATVNTTTLPIYIAAMTDLLKFRIQQYGSGTPPPEPPADSRATGFLIGRTVWTSKGFDKSGTVQKIVDLIGIAGRQMSTAQGVDKDQLARLLADSAGAISAIGVTEQNPTLGPAAQPLMNAGADSRMAPASLMQAINSTLTVVVTAFPAVHKPGMLTTMPSSHPAAVTTAPVR